MKLQHILASSMALLGSEPPKRQIESLFTFGDSYTKTGFNTSLTQPSLDNPMGNPPLGQGATAPGMNWVGHIVATLNSSIVLNYNMAVYNAVVNESIVGEPGNDVIHQVDNFRTHYCPTPGSSSIWDPETAVFLLWIGINELSPLAPLPAIYLTDLCSVWFNMFEEYPYANIYRVLDSYLRLVEELYDCGARQFVVLNVPPTTRTPEMLAAEASRRYKHDKILHNFNWELTETVTRWRRSFPSISIDMYDSWSFMTHVLDNYDMYGFVDNSCIGDGCIWWDGFHPSSAFHYILAADIQDKLALTS